MSTTKNPSRNLTQTARTKIDVPEVAPPFVPAFLRTRDVLRITSLSRATLYRRINARRFPAPIHLGGRACGWSITAIQEWIMDPDGYRAPAMHSPPENISIGTNND